MDSKNVFVNCPFDNQYFPLLKCLLFTLIYFKLNPLISETSDSGEVRINKIKGLISSSQYSIHDLSRMEPLKSNDLPRFNMPFECGIDFGIRVSNPEKFKNKKLLILEKERYRYQKVISDISGNDIKKHDNDPEQIVKALRDWFKVLKVENIPFYKEVWLAFNQFEADYNTIMNESGYDPNDIGSITFKDLIENISSWIDSYKKNVS